MLLNTEADKTLLHPTVNMHYLSCCTGSECLKYFWWHLCVFICTTKTVKLCLTWPLITFHCW